MTEHQVLSPTMASRSVFLAWGPPAYTMRTRLLAGKLGIPVEHIYSTRRRGALAAPFKYSYQTVATLIYLVRNRPRLIFVQSPPSLAVLLVAMYTALSRADFVVDAHSDAFMSPYWSRPRWLHRMLSRRALATIVTNAHFAGKLEGWGAQACVVRDIPTTFAHNEVELGSDFNVLVIATFATDEPLDDVVQAARMMPNVRFRITGDYTRQDAAVPTQLPSNVELTGFVSAGDFYGMLRYSDAALALTTRDHTMQRGACEALWLGTPIITSNWPLLVDYFKLGAVHVDNTANGIRQGIETMQIEIARYRNEIVELRTEVEVEWDTASRQLLEVLTSNSGGEMVGRVDSTPGAPQPEGVSS